MDQQAPAACRRVTISGGGWFASRGSEPTRPARVFCFAHAGGDPRSFLHWQSDLGLEAELVAVCVPGRGHRAEEPFPSLAEFIDGAATAIRTAATNDTRPVYLFGHSLGALVAFEVARRLDGLPGLRHLVASGISAPSLLPSRRVVELSRLEGREFAEAVGFFGGVPVEILADEDLLALVLPGVIADFRMAAEYRYRPAPPITVPTSVINGRDDPHVGAAQVAAWRGECRTPPSWHWADGGHFYFDKQPSAIIDLLVSVIRDDQHVELI